MKRIAVWIIFLFVCLGGFAQKIAVKTNLLYDVTTTLNLGAEFRVAPKWTIDLSGNYNPFNLGNDRKMRHWLVQPEVRYWFCEAFNGHFLALHALGGQFNVADMDLKILRITVIRGVCTEPVSVTVISLCCPSTGTWGWKSEPGGYVPTTTSTTVRIAGNGAEATRKTISA